MTAPTYPTPNPAPYDDRPARPLIVTVSSYLLYGVAVLQLLVALFVLLTLGAVRDAFEGSYGTTEFDSEMGTFVTATMVVIAVIYIVIAIGLTVLSFFNSRGKNPSRIVTWVFAGLGLCCNTLGLTDSFTSAVNTSGGAGAPSDAQIDAEFDAAMPGWFEPAVFALLLLTVVALLAVIILLALPQSNAYFRKQVAWNPGAAYPQPGYGGYNQPYPGQPSYPPYPGAPGPYGAQPGAPGPYGAQPGSPGSPYGAQPGSPGSPYGAQPGSPGSPYGPQPGPPPGYQGQSYPVQPSPGQPAPPPYPEHPPYPGASHYGAPEQYGQPGQPAPGLPPYPGQAGTPAPGGPDAPPPPSDPWAAPPPSTGYQSGGDEPRPEPPAGDQPPASDGGQQPGGDQPNRPPADPA